MTNRDLIGGDEQSVIDRLNKIKLSHKEEEIENVRRSIRNFSGKLASIIELARKLFEEKSCGNIPETLFKEMMLKYHREQVNIETSLISLNNSLTELEFKKERITDWTKLIRQYAKIEKLDRKVLFELIERIEISDKKLIDGTMKQKITIVYKFAGNIAA